MRRIVLHLVRAFAAGALCGLWLLVAPAFAQADSAAYVADIELQTEAELTDLLQRADRLLLEEGVDPDGAARVNFVLHGPVLRALLRDNYAIHKPTVDLAASLSALGMVEFQACRTWMDSNGLQPERLQPFVRTVAYGSGEVNRLLREEGRLSF